MYMFNLIISTKYKLQIKVKKIQPKASKHRGQ